MIPGAEAVPPGLQVQPGTDQGEVGQLPRCQGSLLSTVYFVLSTVYYLLMTVGRAAFLNGTLTGTPVCQVREGLGQSVGKPRR